MLRAIALVGLLVAFVVAQDLAGQQRGEGTALDASFGQQRGEGTALEKRSAEEPQTLVVEEEAPSSRAKRQWGGGYGGYGYQPYGGYGGGYGGYGGYGPQRTVIIKKVIIGGGSPFYGK